MIENKETVCGHNNNNNIIYYSIHQVTNNSFSEIINTGSTQLVQVRHFRSLPVLYPALGVQSSL